MRFAHSMVRLPCLAGMRHRGTGRERRSALIEIRVVVVPGKYAVDAVARIVPTFVVLFGLPERRVALEQVDPDTIPMRRAPIP
jgi:hypothetical protein